MSKRFVNESTIVNSKYTISANRNGERKKMIRTECDELSYNYKKMKNNDKANASSIYLSNIIIYHEFREVFHYIDDYICCIE